MTPTLLTLVEEIEKCAKAATPGPWNWDVQYHHLLAYLNGKNEIIIWPANAITGGGLRDDGEMFTASDRLGACGDHANSHAEDNAAHIALCSPSNILLLTSALRSAMEQNATLRMTLAGLLGRYREHAKHGDCVHWDVEKEAVVINAKEALSEPTP